MPGSDGRAKSAESIPIRSGILPPGVPVRLADKLLIVLFLMGLIAPLVDGSFRSPPNRSPGDLNLRPELAWDGTALAEYPRKFNLWYGDSFGMRDRLLRLHGAIDWFVLGVSPTTALVLGHGDWIELTWWNTLPVWRGVAGFGAKDLEDWRALLEYRRDWLARRGIDYMFALAPIKAEIYPERLPARFDRIGPPRREEFCAYMAAHSSVEILDLTKPLALERRNDTGRDDELYYRLGVHWTDRGLLIGYQELVRRLQKRFPDMQPWSRADFDLQPAADPGDSWAYRLYMDGILVQEPLDLIPVRKKLSRPVANPHATDNKRRFEFANEDPSLPVCLVNGDSFSEPISEFLAEHFSTTIGYRGVSFDAPAIERDRPDVVIQLFNERQLVMQSPKDLLDRAKQELGPLDDEVPPREPRARTATPVPAAQFDASRKVLLALDLSPGAPLPDAFDTTRILQSEGGGFVVEMRQVTDGFLLPPFEFPASGIVLLQIDLESPAPTALGVMFENLSEGIASEWGVRREVQVPGGRQTSVIDVVQLIQRGRVIVHPGRLPGRYVVRRVEVRGLGD